jgi:hypothetical protein
MDQNEFEIFDPSRFFAEFVLRAYRDHLGNPADRYHLKVAVHQANVLAERIWITYHDKNPEKVANSKSASEYRTFLAEHECKDFQFVWDLDDGHKHVVLRRKNRKVTSAAQTGFKRMGGSFDADAFDSAAFDTGKLELMVQLDDGTERLVSEILGNVVGMWEAVLKRIQKG